MMTNDPVREWDDYCDWLEQDELPDIPQWFYDNYYPVETDEDEEEIRADWAKWCEEARISAAESRADWD